MPITSLPGAKPSLPEHKIGIFVLGRAKSALPQSDNSPPCRRVRTSGPGSAVAERNLGAARPLRNVIVAAYPLRNVNGSRLPVAKRYRCAARLLFMLPLFRIFEFLCD